MSRNRTQVKWNYTKIVTRKDLAEIIIRKPIFTTSYSSPFCLFGFITACACRLCQVKVREHSDIQGEQGQSKPHSHPTKPYIHPQAGQKPPWLWWLVHKVAFLQIKWSPQLPFKQTTSKSLQNTSSEPLTPLSLSASTGHLCLCFNVFSLFLPASATGYESCSNEMLDEQYLNFSLFVFQVVLKNAKTLRLCVSWLDSFYLKGNSRLEHKKYDYKQKLRCSNCNISFPRTGTSSSSLLCCDWQVLIAVNHPFNCQKAFLTWKKLVLIYNTAIFTTMIWKKKKSLACISQYCEK